MEKKEENKERIDSSGKDESIDKYYELKKVLVLFEKAAKQKDFK